MSDHTPVLFNVFEDWNAEFVVPLHLQLISCVLTILPDCSIDAKHLVYFPLFHASSCARIYAWFVLVFLVTGEQLPRSTQIRSSVQPGRLGICVKLFADT